MRKLSLFVVACTLLFLAGSVFAQNEMDYDYGQTDSSVEVRNRNLDTRIQPGVEVRVNPVNSNRVEPIRAEVLATSTADVEVRVRLEAEQRRAEAERRRAEMEQTVRERREMAAENRSNAQAQVATRKAEITLRLMSATIARLEKIGDRIESRIEKLKTAGGDTAESESFLAAARADLVNAEASLEVLVGIDLSEERLQDNLQRIRAVAAEAKGHIRSAHENLVRAVRLLGQVQASVRVEVEAEVESN